ncbi:MULTISPECIES: hypothetical protein [Agrobacterium]|jgi:hypothetical protein|uniref:hypothetical protein n=1 Tax=Agrobacterium tumefaciens TaxID=358 RepID=UPI001574D677|nr:hypothetical protein [Agrobacterium tumefaciens]NSZ06456.1 hypothetical protein [Agrobacterium tumefaciens]
MMDPLDQFAAAIASADNHKDWSALSAKMRESYRRLAVGAAAALRENVDTDQDQTVRDFTALVLTYGMVLPREVDE